MMMRGFVLAYPEGAGRIEREANVSWADAKCIANHKIGGSGRSLQHDICILPGDPAEGDRGAIIEIKWLTSASKSLVAQDLWKLALSRSDDPEGKARRTFLVVGGSMRALSNTVTGLNNAGLTLRWSPAGRGNTWPRPSTIDLEKALRINCVAQSLNRLLERGGHVRRPPVCWSKLRASLRWRWFRRLEPFKGSKGMAWRLLVWEFDHGGVRAERIEWETRLGTSGIKCNME